jgi:hypothetical protein
MSWTLQIPFRDRDDLVLDAISAARAAALPDSEQRVVEVLARDALQNGILTVGELLDEIGTRDASGRRRLLDWARERAGIPTTREVDKSREFRRILADDPLPPPSQRNQLPRDAQGRAWQQCPQCGAWPTNEAGAPVPQRAKKWWCPRHRDQAAEGDMDDWQPTRLIALPGGGSRPELTAEDQAYYEEIERKRQAEFEKQQRERESEGAAIARAEERWRREGWVSIHGHKVHPRDVRIRP